MPSPLALLRHRPVARAVVAATVTASASVVGGGTVMVLSTRGGAAVSPATLVSGFRSLAADPRELATATTIMLLAGTTGALAGVVGGARRQK